MNRPALCCLLAILPLTVQASRLVGRRKTQVLNASIFRDEETYWEATHADNATEVLDFLDDDNMTNPIPYENMTDRYGSEAVMDEAPAENATADDDATLLDYGSATSGALESFAQKFGLAPSEAEDLIKESSYNATDDDEEDAFDPNVYGEENWVDTNITDGQSLGDPEPLNENATYAASNELGFEDASYWAEPTSTPEEQLEGEGEDGESDLATGDFGGELGAEEETAGTGIKVFNAPWVPYEAEDVAAEQASVVENTEDEYRVISPPWAQEAEEEPTFEAQGMIESPTVSETDSSEPVEPASDSTTAANQVMHPFWKTTESNETEGTTIDVGSDNDMNEGSESTGYQVMTPLWSATEADDNETEAEAFFTGETDKWSVMGDESGESLATTESQQHGPFFYPVKRPEPQGYELAGDEDSGNGYVPYSPGNGTYDAYSGPEETTASNYNTISVQQLPQMPSDSFGKGSSWQKWGGKGAKGPLKGPKSSKGDCYEDDSKKGGKKQKKCKDGSSKRDKLVKYPIIIPGYPSWAPVPTDEPLAMPSGLDSAPPASAPFSGVPTAYMTNAPLSSSPIASLLSGAPVAGPSSTPAPVVGGVGSSQPQATGIPAPTSATIGTPTIVPAMGATGTPTVTAVTGTSAPTIGNAAVSSDSPSATPTQEVVLAEEEPATNTMWIYPDPVTVEAIGTIDLATEKQVFFDASMSIMQAYLQSFLGPLLLQFNLKLTFLDSETDFQVVGVTGTKTLIKSYFIVSVEILVGSDNMDILVAFTKQRADELVASFFKGIPLERLLETLSSQDVHLDDLRIVKVGISDGGDDPSTPTNGGTDEGTAADDGDVSDGGSSEGTSQPTTGPEPKIGRSPNTALYAGIVSAGVLLIAIVAVVHSSRRRKRKWFNDAVESVASSLYSDGMGPPEGKVLPVLTPNGTSTIRTSTSTVSGRSRIKPAAITMRSQRSAAASSKSSNVRSHGSASTRGSHNLSSPLGTVQESRMGQEEKLEEESDVLVRMEDGPDLLASTTLTCLDGETYSFDNDLAHNYPEFELYSGVPHAWSMDGLTLEDDDEVERILEARRNRWQDQSNDAELGGLPEHTSSHSDAESSRSGYRDSRSSPSFRSSID